MEDNSISIKKIIINSQKEENILLEGTIDKDSYDINILTNNLSLKYFVQNIEDVKLDGIFNGKISFSYKDYLYRINTDMGIEDFHLNDSKLGYLKLNSKWNEKDKRNELDLKIKNSTRDILSSKGYIFLSNDSSNCDLKLKLNKIKANFLEYFLEDVFTDISGYISSRDSLIIKGDITNPDFRGELYLQRFSMKLPYTNVDYTFSGSPKVILDNKKIIMKKIDIIDNIYNYQRSGRW